MKYVSGGSFCISAGILQRAGLRLEAMPFDWLFCGPRSLLAILKDDFSSFLDSQHHVSLSEKMGRSCSMNMAYDGGDHGRPFFNHKDVTTVSDRAYYLRSIDRFRLEAKRGLMLFIVEEFGEIYENFDEIMTALQITYPNSKLFAVKHNHCEGPARMHYLSSRPGGLLSDFYGSAVLSGTNLVEAEHEKLIVSEMQQFMTRDKFQLSH